MIRYLQPEHWIRYDYREIAGDLIEVKSAVMSLQAVPYQRSWVETLQQLELKLEVAGTSRIEGAEFTDHEFEVAIRGRADRLATSSQKQARAAIETYRWIASLPPDYPLDATLILEIHRRIVTGADDDHCVPGQIRQRDENVMFGTPQHRGAEGGTECRTAFGRLAAALEREYREHDPVIQALAAHYHLAAMHPFLDGNGRTARALEAVLLGRAGLRDTSFIAMSNYYYEQKAEYMETLARVRATDHDLTPFLKFGLKGVKLQSRRLLELIQKEISKGLFRNLMYELYHRLKTQKRRVIAERQIGLLNVLLSRDWVDLDELVDASAASYRGLRSARKAVVRDLSDLVTLHAVDYERTAEGLLRFRAALKWPTQFTETEIFAKFKRLPKAKTHSFLG